MSYSFRSSTTGAPLSPLPTPDPSDTYDWAAIQSVRKGATLLTASATQPPVILPQMLKYTDIDNVPQVATFKVDASPKWFTLISSAVDSKGAMTVQLGTIAGKTTAGTRVVRVGTTWSGNGMPGSGQLTEYYYAVA